MKSLLSLQELVAEAAVLLSEAAIDQPSGRVSDVPTVRTVRYYASHGLLDKPAAHRGRAALYNHTHLMQLLAIKRLQAQGLTLEQIQARILSSSPRELASIAQWTPPSTSPQPQPQTRQDWWLAQPAEIDPDSEPQPRDDDPQLSFFPQEEPLPTITTGIELEDGITLLLQDAARHFQQDDLAVLQAAAQPLLRALRARHLL